MTDIPQAIQLVPLREFIVSPGFAGAAAVVGALIVLCVVLYGVRRAGKRHNEELEQRERHHQEVREDEQHAVKAQACWEQLRWLVETAGIEPAASEGATLGLGPELALEILRGLMRDAERLGDQGLADAVTVYQNQIALVLAQQGGPLSGLAGAASVSADGRNKQPVSSTDNSLTDTPSVNSTDDKPNKPPAPDKTPTATTTVAAGGRRRRQ